MDNRLDAFNKGLLVINPGLFAEANCNAQLTLLKAQKIRQLHKTQKYSLKDLANMFNVHISTIHSVVTEKTWRTAKSNNDLKQHSSKIRSVDMGHAYTGS